MHSVPLSYHKIIKSKKLLGARYSRFKNKKQKKKKNKTKTSPKSHPNEAKMKIFQVARKV